MKVRWLVIAVLVAFVAVYWLTRTDEHERASPSPRTALERSASSDPAPAPVTAEAGKPAEAEAAPEAAAADKEKPAPTVDLNVKVTWPGGKPAVGATVTIRECYVYMKTPFERAVRPSPPVKASTETGEDGTAQLTFRERHLNSVQVMVSTPGHATRTKTLYLKSGATDVALELAPTPTVRVAVVDVAGARVTGAKVRMIAPDTLTSGLSSIGAYGVDVAPMKSGNGHFEFPAVGQEGGWRRDDPALLLTATAPGFLPLLRWVKESEFGKGAVELRLIRPVTVRGRCVDAEGRPVAHVRVHEEKTNEDGVFEIESFPETGGEISVAPVALVPFRVKVPAARGPVVDLGDLELRDGKTIHGFVVDEHEKPVAGASVAVWSEALGARVARHTGTAADGAFSAHGLGEGPHVVKVTEANKGRAGWTARTARLPGVMPGARDLRVVLHGGMLLRVDLVDEDGNPARLGHVNVAARHEKGRYDEFNWWPHNTPSLRYGMKKTGVYRVTVQKPGYEKWEQKVTIRADQETRIRVRMVKTSE